ncbi:MAG: hypothetical protein JSS90_05815 [Bacteroidetes bacterium]|jgi:hypothetical protein|nr:hypothetical protein [Bacteroidota bacterium]
MKRILFALILLSVCYTSNSQSRMFFSMSGGILYYNGDLNDKSIVPSTRIFRNYGNASIGAHLTRHLNVQLNYYHGSVEGVDSLTKENDNKKRNLSFESRIDEISLLFSLSLFSNRTKRLAIPYVFAGGGIFFFNPKARYWGSNPEYYGQLISLQPLGTEGQYLTEGDHPKPYKLYQAVIPIGIGTYFRLNQKWRLKVEFAEHFTFTDYLDDASGKYPDMNALAQTPNGDLAVYFSDRRKTKSPLNPKGGNRSNATRNDNYIHFGVGIVYNPREQHPTHYRGPGFFKRLFSGRKGWWGNAGKGL